jgi:hypothetical protein
MLGFHAYNNYQKQGGRRLEMRRPTTHGSQKEVVGFHHMIYFLEEACQIFFRNGWEPSPSICISAMHIAISLLPSSMYQILQITNQLKLQQK